MLFQKFVLRRSTGRVVCDFSKRMGVVYIKMAQIIAMQNYGQIFTENDRQALSQICDHCNPVKFRHIRRQIEAEYGVPLVEKFQYIDPEPLGSASISQVHRAVLLDGREVAVKVKRHDIARRVERDVHQVQRFVHRFGRLTKFRNYLGSDKALLLWSKWIGEETNFAHEQQNLLDYQQFAASVNGKVVDTVQIQTPGLVSELCTDNIIVMELIKAPTINQLTLTTENKQRIARALNDYISLSFYALLQGMPVTFHGDPHSGNIYLDAEGNLGFLDMGLTFSFSGAEAEFIRELFLNAYNARTDKLIKLLLDSSECTEFNYAEYRATIENQAKRFKTTPVTQFFIEMINIYTRYNMAPPDILFKMAKAFVALYGINNFIDNRTDTSTLLAAQIAEYYVRRTVEDLEKVTTGGVSLLPDLITNIAEHGLVKGIATQAIVISKFKAELATTIERCDELLGFFGSI